jgi:hypothetical protein
MMWLVLDIFFKLAEPSGSRNQQRPEEDVDEQGIFIALFFFWLVLTGIYSGPRPSGSGNNQQRSEKEVDGEGKYIHRFTIFFGWS